MKNSFLKISTRKKGIKKPETLQLPYQAMTEEQYLSELRYHEYRVLGPVEDIKNPFLKVVAKKAA